MLPGVCARGALLRLNAGTGLRAGITTQEGRVLKRTSVLIPVVALLAVAANASAKEFVMVGAHCGPMSDAVKAANGVMLSCHEGSGIATAASDTADFAAKVKASGATSLLVEDMMVQWVGPEKTNDLTEQGVNPNDDTYFRNIQWAPQAVQAPAAWAAGCTGAGVRVAIIDGGIYGAHPDLAANIDTAAARSFVPGQPWNNDTGTFWHGTHVAGIVAAIDNSIGVVGIAPKATIVPVKALHGSGGSFGAVISAILYAATPQAEGGAGADIINMSLGATFPKGDGPGTGQLISALNRAVNYSDTHGVLVVSAAGNDGLDLDHSGSYTSVPAQSGSGIAISATGPKDFAAGNTNFATPASYTNYGNSVVYVAAPGGGVDGSNANCTRTTSTGVPVTRPCWVFDLVLSTSRAGYSWAAGTSMAAPAASAVAALIKQKHPEMSLGALKAALAQSADDLGKPGNDPYYGKGFVNAAKACQ